MKKIQIFCCALLCAACLDNSTSAIATIPMRPPTPTQRPVVIKPLAAAPTQPKPAAKYTITIPLTSSIKVHNTSAQTATLTGITIEHTTSENSTPTPITATSIDAKIAPNTGISFKPKISITSSNQATSATYLGVSAIQINGQTIKFSKPWTGLTSDKIYITNKSGMWKIDKTAMKKSAANLAAATPTTVAKKTAEIKKIAPKKTTHVATKAVAIKATVTAVAQAKKATASSKKTRKAKMKSKATKAVTASTGIVKPAATKTVA